MKSSPLSRSTKPMKRSPLRTKPDAAKLTVKPYKRTCRVSGCCVKFTTFDMRCWWCSPEHGVLIAREVVAKKQIAAIKESRLATKAALLDLKPRKWWLAKAKKALHAYIRMRDEGKPCISCDTILRLTGKPGGDYDAGHFRSVGSAKHLEFEEKNIFGQCKYCNDHLKGNQLEYERRLRIRESDAYVEELKADQALRKLAIADFQQIEAHYKAKLKALQATRASHHPE